MKHKYAWTTQRDQQMTKKEQKEMIKKFEDHYDEEFREQRTQEALTHHAKRPEVEIRKDNAETSTDAANVDDEQHFHKWWGNPENSDIRGIDDKDTPPEYILAHKEQLESKRHERFRD